MQTPSNMILLPQGARSCRIKTREERSCESKFRQHNVGVTGAQGWQNKYHISHFRNIIYFIFETHLSHF